MADDGEDKLIAVARHITKTIGRTNTMTKDILQIFSTFDGRLTSEKLAFRNPHEGLGLHNHHPSASEQCLQSLNRKISRFLDLDRPIWSDSADSTAFLDLVDKLLEFIRDVHKKSQSFKHAEELVSKSMLRLEDEFKFLMEHGSPSLSIMAPSDSHFEESDGEDCIIVAAPIKDYNIVIDALPHGTISNLYEIAKRMAAAGAGKVCAHRYSVGRIEFLEESISRLGLHPWTTEEVHSKPWPELESEIKRWVHAIKIAVRVLFPSERRLCHRVFSDLTAVADFAFADVCCGTMVQLLGFADAVAVGSKAPERLFKVVDMHEALRELLPEIDALFSYPRCSFLRSESETVCARLGATIRTIFSELENLIRRDPAKGELPGGGVHPITRYVMNYLRAATASWRTLERVMEEDEGKLSLSVDEKTEDDNVRPSSSLSVQIAWLMDILHTNLEAKSHVYRDESLRSVFLMNNGRYVIQKVKDTELTQILGEEWIRRLIARVRQYHNQYQRATWRKLIDLLHVEESEPSMKNMREKIRRFNVGFEEVCRAQAGWVVADEQLRTELRISAVGFVIPAYTNFLGRCRVVVGPGKNVEKYVKYSVDDVETRIGEMFKESAVAVKKS